MYTLSVSSTYTNDDTYCCVITFNDLSQFSQFFLGEVDKLKYAPLKEVIIKFDGGKG